MSFSSIDKHLHLLHFSQLKVEGCRHGYLGYPDAIPKLFLFPLELSTEHVQISSACVYHKRLFYFIYFAVVV